MPSTNATAATATRAPDARRASTDSADSAGAPPAPQHERDEHALDVDDDDDAAAQYAQQQARQDDAEAAAAARTRAADAAPAPPQRGWYERCVARTPPRACDFLKLVVPSVWGATMVIAAVVYLRANVRYVPALLCLWNVIACIVAIVDIARFHRTAHPHYASLLEPEFRRPRAVRAKFAIGLLLGVAAFVGSFPLFALTGQAEGCFMLISSFLFILWAVDVRKYHWGPKVVAAGTELHAPDTMAPDADFADPVSADVSPRSDSAHTSVVGVGAADVDVVIASSGSE